jgi:hypothetical protein
MGGGARTSPIDDLRESLEMAAADRPSKEERAKNRETTAWDALSVLPVIGNGMSAWDAGEAYTDALAQLQGGRTKSAALSAGRGLLDTAGMFAGFPWSKMAGKAAKDGSSRLNVFVPVEEGKLTERARDIRERGASNEAVYDTTGLNFGPDGTIRRRIPDNKMDIDMSFEPGDITTVGALVNHPTLFRDIPDLQNRIVKVTDKAEMRPGSPMPRGITRTDPETGNFEFSKASADPYADMAKLLQYDINDRVGFASAGRHNFTDQMSDLWKAQLDATRSGADRKAIQAYVDAIERVKGDMSVDMSQKQRFKDMSRKLTDRDAGSTDAKIVRGEADLRGGFGYPYAKNAPWLKGYWTPQDFKDLTVLPPKGATLEDMAQFIEDWKRFGAGAGN